MDEQIKPVAWLIDWPDDPELGHYFAENACLPEYGRSTALYDQQAIDTLRAEVEAVSHELDCMNLNLQGHIAELRRVRDEKRKAEAEADALRKDAERYRWLRENGKAAATGLVMRRPETWDAAIDAAKQGAE